MAIKYLTFVLVYLILSELLPSAASSFVPCQVPLLKNGRAKIQMRGRSVKFKCFNPYKMIGDVRSYCENGEWSFSELPICVTSGCAEVDEPENGFVISSFSGAVKKFYCKPGSLLTKSPGNLEVGIPDEPENITPSDSLMRSVVIYCDGYHWNGTAPTCVPFQTATASEEPVENFEPSSEGVKAAALITTTTATTAPEETETSGSGILPILNSCLNRCEVESNVTKTGKASCDCNQICLMDYEGKPPCCPDYINLCRLDNDDYNPTLKVWAEKFGVSETTLSYLGFGVLVPVAIICALIPIVALMLIRRKGAISRSQQHLRDDSDVRYIVHPCDVEEEDIIDFRLAASNSNLLHLDSAQPAVKSVETLNSNNPKITSI